MTQSLIRRWAAQAASEDGSMVYAIVVSIVAGGLVTILASMAVQSIRGASRNSDFTDVLHVAEAGVQDALRRLTQGEGHGVGIGYQLPGPTDGHLNEGVYRYEVTREDATRWQVRAVGCMSPHRESDFDDCAAAAGRTRTIEALVKRPSRFGLATFADSTIELPDNNLVTSYPAGNLGYVGSNGAVELLGKADVGGVHLFGPDAECGTSVCNSVAADADKEIRGFPNALPLGTDFISRALDACGGLAGLRPFRASDHLGVIPPDPSGYYCASDVIFDVPTTVTGTTADPVIIYATGDVIVDLLPHTGVNCLPVVCDDGKIATALGSPEASALQIYTTGSNFTMNDKNFFTGALYAPQAHCGSQAAKVHAVVYGAVVCNEISNVDGWTFWYDEALADLTSTDYDIAEWREEVGGSTSF